MAFVLLLALRSKMMSSTSDGLLVLQQQRGYLAVLFILFLCIYFIALLFFAFFSVQLKQCFTLRISFAILYIVLFVLFYTIFSAIILVDLGS